MLIVPVEVGFVFLPGHRFIQSILPELQDCNGRNGRMISEACLGRVMLIDDERVDQMTRKRILTRSKMADDNIGSTYAAEALTYLADPENPKVDMIFLDINMPPMTGFEFL